MKYQDIEVKENGDIAKTQIHRGRKPRYGEVVEIQGKPRAKFAVDQFGNIIRINGQAIREDDERLPAYKSEHPELFPPEDSLTGGDVSRFNEKLDELAKEKKEADANKPKRHFRRRTTPVVKWLVAEGTKLPVYAKDKFGNVVKSDGSTIKSGEAVEHNDANTLAKLMLQNPERFGTWDYQNPKKHEEWLKVDRAMDEAKKEREEMRKRNSEMTDEQKAAYFAMLGARRQRENFQDYYNATHDNTAYHSYNLDNPGSVNDRIRDYDDYTRDMKDYNLNVAHKTYNFLESMGYFKDKDKDKDKDKGKDKDKDKGKDSENNHTNNGHIVTAEEMAERRKKKQK